MDKKWKIFRRKAGALGAQPPMAVSGAARDRGAGSARARGDSAGAGVEHRRPPWTGCCCARFAPASVVVSERGDLVYIHGRTGEFLEPAAGQPRLNILDMAREGLQHDLAAALRRAAAQDTEVTREGVRVRSNGDFSYVNLSVTKIHEPESLRGLLLVTFRPRPRP